METNEINLMKHFGVARTTLLYLTVYILVVLVIIFKGLDNNIFLLKIITSIIILLDFPAILLHYFYFLENRNITIFEYEDSVVIYNYDKEQISLNKENIIGIDVFMSNSKFNYGISSGLPTEEYNYLKFMTQEKEIIITSLIYPNIKKLALKFSSIKPQFHNTIFATLT